MDIIPTTNDQLWSPQSINLLLMILKVSLVTLGLLINCFVLYILFRAKIHFSDICTITIFANTLADIFLALTFIATDLLLPSYSSDVAPFMCKFRRYIIHVSQTGELLMTSALALFHKDKLHTRTFGQAPCGVFIFPALIWFLALSCNVWSVVLYECKYTTYIVRKSTSNHSNSYSACSKPACYSLISAVSHLNTEASYVPVALLIETGVTIGIPLLIAGFLLVYAHSKATLVTFRLKLAWLLFIINVLFVMPSIGISLVLAVLQVPPREATFVQIVITTTSQYFQFAHEIAKPLLYFFFQTEVRKVANQFRIGRCFGFGATENPGISIKLTPAALQQMTVIRADFDSGASSFAHSSYTRNGSAASCASEEISVMLAHRSRIGGRLSASSSIHLNVARI